MSHTSEEEGSGVITARDVDYHDPAGTDMTWAETNFFGFYIPERSLCGSVYVVTRRELGVTLADVTLFDTISLDRKDCLLIDCQQALPAPERLSDYELPNGLSIRAVRPPRDYEISYAGRDGTRLELRFDALMDPFTLHPEGESGATTTAIDGYRGHFDMTGRVTGTLTVRGETLAVDCVDTMDHSWGPRPEHSHPDIVWMHAHFGEERAFHAILVQRPELPESERYEFIRGYVLEQGTALPLSGVRLTASRIDGLGVAMQVDATCTNGLELSMHGAAVAATNVGWYSCMDLNYTLHRWVDDAGRVGYGCAQESVMYDRRTARNTPRTASPATVAA